MPKLAKSFRRVTLPDGTTRFFFGEDEFPWFTERGGLKVRKMDENIEDLHIITVEVLVNGPVELD